MAIEKAHHEDYDNQHDRGDGLYNHHALSFLLVIFCQPYHGGVNDKLGKPTLGLGMTPLTDLKGRLFVLQGKSVVGAMAIRTIGR